MKPPADEQATLMMIAIASTLTGAVCLAVLFAVPWKFHPSGGGIMGASIGFVLAATVEGVFWFWFLRRRRTLLNR